MSRKTYLAFDLLFKLPMHHGKISNRHGIRPHRSGWAFWLMGGFCLFLSLPIYGQRTNAGITFEETKAKAEKGEVISQNAMGLMYATGEGARKDCFEAARWFRKAAEQGDAQAQYHIAFYFYDGERIDYQQAISWYRKAAEQGLADAQNELGIMYSWGKGVSENLDEAIKWFQRAADQGNVTAKANLVKAVRTKQAKGLWQGDGVALKTPQPQKPRPLPRVQSTNEITTTEGVTYKSISILKVQPDGLLVEFPLQSGGIGMATLKFENLSIELQQKYGYDPQRAIAYQAQQALGQGQFLKGMQAQQEREWAEAKAKDQDNYKGRLEIEKLENERKVAEAAMAQAEAASKQAEADRIRAMTPQPQPQVNVQMNQYNESPSYYPRRYY